jgi:hypothetical protein
MNLSYFSLFAHIFKKGTFTGVLEGGGGRQNGLREGAEQCAALKS